MTEQQINRLDELEPYLSTAVYSNYVRSMKLEDAKFIASIYKELTGKNTNINCPRCVLEICKTVGKTYYTIKKQNGT